MTALPTNATLRLDRFLSHASGHSRSQVRRLLRAGAVTVDGVVASDATQEIGADTCVALDGQQLEWPCARYLMLHKPAGYVCGNDDPAHASVTSLVATGWARELHSAGRLDADTTGLVLLTNDGDWSHRVTSPRRHCDKTYLVQLKHPLAPDCVQRFAEGLLLNGETRATLPAQLVPIDSHTARVTIHEGRYHQVKRMFAACGNRVEGLHRESIGSIRLDPALQPGQWRALRDDEIRSFTDG